MLVMHIVCSLMMAEQRSYWDSSRAIGVRRLLRPMNASFETALSKFAEANIGKSYNFNLIQMLGKKKSSSIRQANTKEVDPAESEKLFCSELVAAAYIHCGVSREKSCLLISEQSQAIDPSSVASNFLPATFAKSKLLDVFASGFQLMGLMKFPVWQSSKCLDVVWARFESVLRSEFRAFVTSGKVATFDRKSPATKLFEEMRSSLVVVCLFDRDSQDSLELAFEAGDEILVLNKVNVMLCDVMCVFAHALERMPLDGGLDSICRVIDWDCFRRITAM